MQAEGRWSWSWSWLEGLESMEPSTTGEGSVAYTGQVKHTMDPVGASCISTTCRSMGVASQIYGFITHKEAAIHQG